MLECTTPLLIEVVHELAQNCRWNPLYLVSNYQRDLVAERFPSAIYQDTVDARYGRPARELSDLPASGVIDQPTAEDLGYAQVIALKQMDRMELLGAFPFRDRVLHFHRLVAYWSAVFDRLHPDVLLMFTSPHVVYDYIAYALARRRGIRTIMCEYVGTDEGLLMAIDRFEDGLPPLMAEYARLRADPPGDPIVLSDRLEASWRRLRGSYEQALPTATRKFWIVSEKQQLAEKAAAAVTAEQAAAPQTPPALARPEAGARSGASGGRLGRAVSAFLRELSNGARKDEATAPLEAPAPQPIARPAPPPAGGHYNGRFYDFAPEDIARKSDAFRRAHREAMRRRYDELVVPPDLDRPFVYVPLHMQPERSTNPNGGVFDDQDVMVGMIGAAMPAGWRVYVKEHPSQFAYATWIERGRWTRFYDALAAHAGVSLVPLDTPQFELIDRARAVATVCGTSSWEAIVRGVPSLVFGEAWYKGCDGAFTVRTLEDCRRALARIEGGERPDPEAVRLFLHAVDRTAFPGYLGDDEQTFAGIDEATNIARLAREIDDCYRAAIKARGQPASASA